MTLWMRRKTRPNEGAFSGAKELFKFYLSMDNYASFFKTNDDDSVYTEKARGGRRLPFRN